MFKINNLHQIDEVVDAIVLDGGALKLVDEVQLAVHVFPKDELDIVTICEDAIDLYVESEGQDIFSSTFHTEDACVHVFFTGRSAQMGYLI